MRATSAALAVLTAAFLAQLGAIAHAQSVAQPGLAVIAAVKAHDVTSLEGMLKKGITSTQPIETVPPH